MFLSCLIFGYNIRQLLKNLLLGFVMIFGCISLLQAQKIETISKSYSFYIDPKVESPTEFIQKYVLDSIYIWQKKGRYETTSEYKIRVTEDNRQALAKQLTKNAENAYLKKYYGNTINFELEDYDTDNESFLFKNNMFGKIVVPVARSKAEMFEKSWHIDNSKVELFIDGDKVRIKKIPFISQGEVYWYDNTQSAVFAATKTNVQLPTLELDLSTDEQYENQQKIVEQNITVGKSDVDLNIPVSASATPKTFVVIIANENYKRVGKVPYALNDGCIFKEYCNKTLGIPMINIKYTPDATLNDIRAEINWLKEVLKAYNGEAKAIVFYSGHGIPDESTATAFLLPTDGYGTDIETAFSLNNLYKELSEVPSERITYFIDACFSGAKRDGDMLMAARGIAIKVKSGPVQGNAVVFSAATGDQTAYPYTEKQHGLFSYFLLKKLQETNGDVDYQTLSDYISTNVKLVSSVIKKLQSPTTTPGNSLNNKWKTWKLK